MARPTYNDPTDAQFTDGKGVREDHLNQIMASQDSVLTEKLHGVHVGAEPCILYGWAAVDVRSATLNQASATVTWGDELDNTHVWPRSGVSGYPNGHILSTFVGKSSGGAAATWPPTTRVDNVFCHADLSTNSSAMTVYFENVAQADINSTPTIWYWAYWVVFGDGNHDSDNNTWAVPTIAHYDLCDLAGSDVETKMNQVQGRSGYIWERVVTAAGRTTDTATTPVFDTGAHTLQHGTRTVTLGGSPTTFREFGSDLDYDEATDVKFDSYGATDAVAAVILTPVSHSSAENWGLYDVVMEGNPSDLNSAQSLGPTPYMSIMSGNLPATTSWNMNWLAIGPRASAQATGSWSDVDFSNPTAGVTNVPQATMRSLRDNEKVMIREYGTYALSYSSATDTYAETLSQLIQAVTFYLDVSSRGVENGVLDNGLTIFPAKDPYEPSAEADGSEEIEEFASALTYATGTGIKIKSGGIQTTHIGARQLRKLWYPASTENWYNKTTAGELWFGGDWSNPHVYLARQVGGGSKQKGELVKVHKNTGVATVVWQGGDTHSDFNGEDFEARDVALRTVGATLFAYVTDGAYSGGRVAKINTSSGALDTTYTNFLDSAPEHSFGITFDSSTSHFTVSPVKRSVTTWNKLTYLNTSFVAQGTDSVTYTGYSGSYNWDAIIALGSPSNGVGWAVVANVSSNAPPNELAAGFIEYNNAEGDSTAIANCGAPPEVNEAKGLVAQTGTRGWWVSKEATNDYWIMQFDIDADNLDYASQGKDVAQPRNIAPVGIFARPYQRDNNTRIGWRYIMGDEFEANHPLPGPHRIPSGEVLEIDRITIAELDSGTGYT